MKLLSTLLIFIPMLGLIPEHSQAQRVSGGGTDTGVNEQLLNSFLDPQQDILKRALTNYLNTLNEEQIGDPNIKELMRTKFKKNDLLQDIHKSTYVIGGLGNCKDEYNNKVAASAVIGQQGGPICFDTKTLAKDYVGLDTESTLIKLASLALHEHIHHLQPAITSKSSGNRDLKISELESEGFRFSAYVLITAKSANLPTLKWTQEMTVSDDPVSAQKNMCTNFSKLSSKLKTRIKTQEEIFSMWKELSDEAEKTYFISNALASVSIGILTAALVNGSMGYRLVHAYYGGGIAVVSSLTIGAGFVIFSTPDDGGVIWKEPFYANNYINEVEKVLEQVNKVTSNVKFDYSRLANGLSFGSIAASRIGLMSSLQRKKLKLLKGELDYVNVILENCYTDKLK